MGKLAVTGGSRVRVKGFPAWPVFDSREQVSMEKVLKSGKWWRFSYGEGIDWHEPTSGERSEVALFQEEFAAHQGARYGIACINGTGALDMTVRAAGIGPGDEVIVPSYTYVASATCVLQSNAVPIFVDVDPQTYNIDPGRVEEAITERTRAIIPCHFGGQVADMDRLRDIASRHGLLIIEDAAHAHGSRWKDKGAGTMGVAGTFSFQNAKNMTAGEGGIVITDSFEMAETLESLTWSGRRHGRPWYEFHQLGWNYRMLEFQGTLLRTQLKRLEEQNRVRRENALYLTELLREIGGLQPVTIDPRAEQYSVHIFMLRYDPREFGGLERVKLMDAVNAEGVPAFGGYTHPLYKNPMFLEKAFYTKGCPITCGHYGRELDYGSFESLCPVSERACNFEAIWLEHRLFLGGRSDMEDIAAAFRKVKENVSEIA